jgi:glycerophosphoryl diester phosphodiesterase
LTSDRLACPSSYLKLLDADAYHPSIDNLGLSSLSGELDLSSIIDIRQSGRSINVWTCNEKHQIRQLITAGVTGLISDFPNRVNDLLLEAV